MHPAFATIQFGPFLTQYHQRAVNKEFREALSAYLEAELLPQVDEPFGSTTGSLTAEVNEERLCGPGSLVKDTYKLDFQFLRPGSPDKIQAKIRRSPRTGAFTSRDPLYLWTVKRKKQDEIYRANIDDIVARITRGESAAWQCPRCESPLRLVNQERVFDLTCPRGCFNYSFHRDPTTGEFLHGHFFSRPKPLR
jgi:hypothetical protein